MTRRIVRTSIQLGFITFLVLLFVFVLDNRYRVLPNRIHTYLPNHHDGLVVTDITVTTCGRLSSCTLDPDKWRRVEKDLYLDKGWFSQAYVHVQRKHEEELLDTDSVVFDIRVGRLDPTTSKKDQEAQRWEARPAGIWISRSFKRHASDSRKAITAVDVLFGADAVDPRHGWEIKDQALMLSSSGDVPEPRLSIRRGFPKTVTKPIPRVKSNGKFKLLQVSDLHLSTGFGACRDIDEPGHCEADPRTLQFVASILDSENPDLVVLSGDQVNGETAPDAPTALFKMAELFVSRGIPYATIFGNHDDERSLSRSSLMELIQTLPWSLSEPGPSTVDGVGNYVVEVLGRGTSSNSALTLYLLDTHGYSPDETRYKGYDWLKASQIEWFREQASSRRHSAAHKDYAYHHFNMAFIHIPLPEYRNFQNIVPGSGEHRENPTGPGFNSGFMDALIENDVFAVSCGHDHANDYCVNEQHSASTDKDLPHKANHLYLCYAGGSGFGGYGGYGGYRRRVRVWEFDFNVGRVETWKRVEGEAKGGEKRVDMMVVAEGGVVQTHL